jgi:uncharacterized damage-inducible protein DinB
MKRRDILATFACAAVPASAQTCSFALQFRDGFMKHWEVERGYTLAVAEAMPAEHYNFKPNPVQRSFGEQLIHLAAANIAYFSAFDLIPMPERVTVADKETVPKYLNSSWDYTIQVLRKLTEKDILRNDLGTPRFKAHTGSDLLLRAYTHTAHHRGQAIVYLRIKDITPPTWAFEPTAH